MGRRAFRPPEVQNLLTESPYTIYTFYSPFRITQNSIQARENPAYQQPDLPARRRPEEGDNRELGAPVVDLIREGLKWVAGWLMMVWLRGIGLG